ncbi:MAG TPA: biotin/lipoyl-containing protein, partial [Bacteroidales bacterium]|nr:biotin/lipoyl-containing protein [Bacteroidales bacterium]
MISEVKIPSPGESITEVLLARWFVEDGDQVEKDQELGEVESDKATLPLISGSAGAISILVKEGETIKVGTIACKIDSEKAGKAKAAAAQPEVKEPQPEVKEEKKEAKPVQETPTPKVEAPVEKPAETTATQTPQPENVKVTPLARKMMDEHHLSVKDIIDGLQRISTSEVEMVVNAPAMGFSKPETTATRDAARQKMTPLR